MTWQISNKAKSIFGSLCLAVILLLIIFWAVGKGQKLAQADIIIQTAGQTQKALSYFYQDQNRYPSAVEFADQNTMLNYLNVFPLPEFASVSCPQTFNYNRTSDTSYTLSFCLPSASGTYKSGWNSLSGNLGSQ
ncbi:MAG: hypothetical protein P4L74_05275 [Candidatus Doudnabacteria bacterium]|nr:hypothetical protein [Candidatus Doudnabacteria bacterium]